MAAIPKKVSDRFSKELSKYKKALKNAEKHDIGEADTVDIITRMLSDIFGYDLLTEITREYAVRKTFCDIAIKYKDKLQYLIEVKSIGTSLNENHLRQVSTYGAKEGIDWVVLTNGDDWQIYKLKVQGKVDEKLLCKFKITELNLRKDDDKDKLFILCKEAISKSAIENFHDYVQSVNKFTVAATLLSDPIISLIRKELRRVTPGLKVDVSEIEKILRNETLKRDVLDGKEASDAARMIKRVQNNKKAV